ncbi:MAG: hypothetical protein Q9182_001493 [Xanthomendoza sp. 2 TL-2023]
MHTLTTIILCSIFAFLTSALPAIPKASANQVARRPDKCGPVASLQHANGDPKDTCSDVPTTDSTTTSYKIAPITGYKIPRPIPDWSICGPPSDQLCEAITTNATAARETWLFITSKVTTGVLVQQCQVGIYIPSAASAAPRPTQKQCKAILESIISASRLSKPAVPGATVNLKNNPAKAEGQFELPNGSGTGRNRFSGYSAVLQRPTRA